MAIDWISTRDRLPPPGQYVLIRHRYRLAEYDTPYSVGVYVEQYKGFAWVCMALRPYTIGDVELTKLAAHTVSPGSNYVTHWAEIDAPAQGEIK